MSLPLSYLYCGTVGVTTSQEPGSCVAFGIALELTGFCSESHIPREHDCAAKYKYHFQNTLGVADIYRHQGVVDISIRE